MIIANELTGINDNRFEIKYSGYKIREKEQTKTEQHNIYTPSHLQRHTSEI